MRGQEIILMVLIFGYNIVPIFTNCPGSEGDLNNNNCESIYGTRPIDPNPSSTENHDQLELQKNGGLYPRLTEYYGYGYNIFTGNPTAVHDNGYQIRQIYKFTYDETVQTNDGLYFVPKEVTVGDDTSCKYDSSSHSYTGMKSYHDDLSVSAGLKVGYDAGVEKYAFSASTTYKSVKEQISNQSSVVVVSSFKCNLYNAAIQSDVPFSDDFLNSLNQAHDNNNWDQFIMDWGTHFADKVNFGAAAVRQSKFSQESVQNLQSQGIDVAIAAQGNFLTESGAVNIDVNASTYLNDVQKNYFQKSSMEESTYYIGRPPPADQNISNWISQIKDGKTTPAPTSIVLKPINGLFEELVNRKILSDEVANQMKLGFDAAVDKYIKNLNQVPDSDPVLFPATILQSRSLVSGGNGGDYFIDEAINNVFIRAVEVNIKSSDTVESIRLGLSYGMDTYYTPWRGRDGGLIVTFSIPENDRIVKANVWYDPDGIVNGIQFVTNNSITSDIFGRGQGDLDELFIDGYLIGLFGRSSAKLDAIGFLSNVYSYDPSTPKYATFATMYYGGNGGYKMQWYSSRDDDYASELYIKYDVLLDGLQLTLSNREGNPIQVSPLYGGPEVNNQRYFYFDWSSQISTIQMNAGSKVDAVTFTIDGATTQVGGDGGNPFNLDLPNSKLSHLVGVYGRSSDIIDRLGFVFRVAANEIPPSTKKIHVIGAFFGLSDVTNEVQNLINTQGGRKAAFQIPQPYWPDSWIGQKKSFIIYWQADDGIPQVQSGQEGATFSINVEDAPTSPYINPTNTLRIIGCAFGLADFTSKCQSMISNNRLSLTASDEVFSDSWPGQAKSFVIIYQLPDGPIQKLTFKEGANVVIPDSNNMITIMGAFFGLSDVTEKTQAVVDRDGGQIVGILSNAAYWGDSWPGVLKTFNIYWQTNNGYPNFASMEENSSIMLTIGSDLSTANYPAPDGLQIIGCSYGLQDYTKLCQSLVSNNKLALTASNSVFGDPWPGKSKSFDIVYRVSGGSIQRLSVKNDQSISIP